MPSWCWRCSERRRIRAKGLELTNFSAKDLALLAEAELERNRGRFIAEAEQHRYVAGLCALALSASVRKVTKTEHSPNADSANARLIAND